MPTYDPQTDSYELSDPEFNRLLFGTERNRSLGAANRARVLEMAQAGMTAQQIAGETGLHFTSVHRHLRAMGVPGTRRRRKQLAMSMLASGASHKAVAEVTGLAIGTVYVYAWQLARCSGVDPLLL